MQQQSHQKSSSLGGISQAIVSAPNHQRDNSEPNTPQRNNTNGQGVWNNKKRIFETSSGNGSNHQRHAAAEDANSAERSGGFNQNHNRGLQHDRRSSADHGKVNYHNHHHNLHNSNSNQGASNGRDRDRGFGGREASSTTRANHNEQHPLQYSASQRHHNHMPHHHESSDDNRGYKAGGGYKPGPRRSYNHHNHHQRDHHHQDLGPQTQEIYKPNKRHHAEQPRFDSGAEYFQGKNFDNNRHSHHRENREHNNREHHQQSREGGHNFYHKNHAGESNFNNPEHQQQRDREQHQGHREHRSGSRQGDRGGEVTGNFRPSQRKQSLPYKNLAAGANSDYGAAGTSGHPGDARDGVDQRRSSFGRGAAGSDTYNRGGQQDYHLNHRSNANSRLNAQNNEPNRYEKRSSLIGASGSRGDQLIGATRASNFSNEPPAHHPVKEGSDKNQRYPVASGLQHLHKEGGQQSSSRGGYHHSGAQRQYGQSGGQQNRSSPPPRHRSRSRTVSQRSTSNKGHHSSQNEYGHHREAQRESSREATGSPAHYTSGAGRGASYGSKGSRGGLHNAGSGEKGHSSGALSASRGGRGGGQFYYVGGQDAWISKSDYFNPNNPHFLGRGRKRGGRGGGPNACERSGSGHGVSRPAGNDRDSRSPSGHHSPEANYERAGNEDSLEARAKRVVKETCSRVGANEHLEGQPQDQKPSPSHPHNHDEHKAGGRSPSASANERDQPLQQNALTQKMSVAASSPSRAPLEIVRRIPPATQVSNSKAEKAARPTDEGMKEAVHHAESRKSSLSGPATVANNNQHNADTLKQDSPPNGGNERSPQQQKQPESMHSEAQSPQSQESHQQSQVDSQGAQDDLIKITSEEVHDIPAFGGTEDKLPLTRKNSQSGALVAGEEKQTIAAAQDENMQQPLSQKQDQTIEDDNLPLVDQEDKDSDHQYQRQSDMGKSAGSAAYPTRREKIIYDANGNVIDPKDNCNLYIAGIPLRTTQDQMRKIFSQFGSIIKVDIIKDQKLEKPRGFAYVLYRTGLEANNAIENMDQTSPFHNHWKITVEHAKRGEVVTRDQVDRIKSTVAQKPYGSSSFGYDFESQSSFNNSNGRGGRGGFHDHRGGHSFRGRDHGPPMRGERDRDFYMNNRQDSFQSGGSYRGHHQQPHHHQHQRGGDHQHMRERENHHQPNHHREHHHGYHHQNHSFQRGHSHNFRDQHHYHNDRGNQHRGGQQSSPNHERGERQYDNQHGQHHERDGPSAGRGAPYNNRNSFAQNNNRFQNQSSNFSNEEDRFARGNSYGRGDYQGDRDNRRPYQYQQHGFQDRIDRGGFHGSERGGFHHRGGHHVPFQRRGGNDRQRGGKGGPGNNLYPNRQHNMNHQFQDIQAARIRPRSRSRSFSPRQQNNEAEHKD